MSSPIDHSVSYEGQLVVVDQLVITFLVDNNIEW